jgi:hypothetical protein
MIVSLLLVILLFLLIEIRESSCKNFVNILEKFIRTSEENIFAQERGNKRRTEKIMQWELHNMYPSRRIIRVIKSRSMRQAGHVV